VAKNLEFPSKLSERKDAVREENLPRAKYCIGDDFDEGTMIEPSMLDFRGLEEIVLVRNCKVGGVVWNSNR